MSYDLQIERLDDNGLPLGSPAIESLASKSDAIMVMNRAIERAVSSRQSMQFSVYGPGKQLLVQYTSATCDRRAPELALA